MPPPLPATLESLPPALAKRIDTLHRSARQMTALTILGLIFPILLLIGAPLGLLYRRWLRKLFLAPELQGDVQAIFQADPGQRKAMAGAPTIQGKLAYLHVHRSAFLVPVTVLAFVLLLLGVFILIVEFSNPAR